MREDAPQTAGESSQFEKLNAFEFSPLGGSVMTLCCRKSLDMKCSKSCLYFFIYIYIYHFFLLLNTAGGPCRRNIYSKDVFPVLNIIDYFLYFRVCF